MPQFDPTAFGPASRLLVGDRLPELGRGRPNLAMRPHLKALTLEKLFPQGMSDVRMGRACLAGLWLWHDFLDESHEISQEISTPYGSFWHGIMHRRESDYANAKYWLRRVGTHPVFQQLAVAAEDLGYGKKPWDPLEFVDLCEQYKGTGNATELMLIQVQRCEWQLFFSWCWKQTVSRPVAMA